MFKDKYQHSLELNLNRDRFNRTICTHQYATYPLRLSPIFRLDNIDKSRAYLYTLNTSPGLLAGDELNVSLKLETNTKLHLTDQAATKVHPMPIAGTQAAVNYYLELQSEANLELVPEPIILYTDAALSQSTSIKLDRTAKLFLSEIILPGRLAKGEFYQFNYYSNRLKVTDLTDKLLLTNAMHLEGTTNPFKNSRLFTPLSIMGSAIAIYPDLDLKLLSKELASIQTASCPRVVATDSIIPGDRGLLIRAFAHKTEHLKQYFHLALNCIRSLTNQTRLPYIPK